MRTGQEEWRSLHSQSIVWLLHDHFYHRVDANLAMNDGGVTAKTVVPIGDLAIYNDSPGEDHVTFYRRTLAQREGWGAECRVRLERTRALYESRPDRFILAESANDVVRARREGRSAVFLGMEGCKAFEGRLEVLEMFCRLGVRQMQLTWAEPNQFVTVSPSGTWHLSHFGRNAVAAMNGLGVVIDLAHAPWSLFEEVLDASKQPVIVSHGAPSEPHPGSGDMTAGHLRALKSCGGLLGLHFCRHYINGPGATFEDFLDTVDYLVGNGYEDIVALGGDLFEDDPYFRARHAPPHGVTHETWRVFIDELSDVRLMPNITRGLVERGHSRDLVQKIVGGNVLRVYRAVLGS